MYNLTIYYVSGKFEKQKKKTKKKTVEYLCVIKTDVQKIGKE